MAQQAAKTDSFAVRHHFLIRRLHSLCGLVPIGVFLCIHLTVNASINAGAAEFETQVGYIHALGWLLKPVEIMFIFLPLLFHGVLGLQIWFSGQPNVSTYKYGGNFRYMFQRVTGGIAFVFILYHLWHMHWLGAPFGGGKFIAHGEGMTESAATAMQDVVFGVPASVLYGIGVLSAVYHLANGIWTSLITWGITIGPLAQRRAGYACSAFGVMLAVVGLSGVRGFKTFEPEADSHMVGVDTDVPPPFVKTVSDPGGS